ALAGEKIEQIAVLTVGINGYQNISSTPGGINDARGVAARFEANGKQLGLRSDAVWVRSLCGEEATRSEILASLKELRAHGAPNTLAVISFSGHGSRRGGSWSYIPYDYESGDPETELPAAEITRVARDLAKRGCVVVIILDTCFAGEFRHTADE